MTEWGSGLVTLLFTDLVGSTELLTRAGDQEAQRIFSTHRRLLSEAVDAHGGHEVKWLGDGLMVAFPSAADALGCAIAMQRAARRPVEGEHLSVRVGLNAGEALRDIDDYFGTPVVIARRLCDRAEGGQILCTETVAGLLAGRGGFSFAELGKLALKGVPEPVAACEVTYEVSPAHELPTRPPMVGRDAELKRLLERLGDALAGRGGLATVTGEPGIGKTRMLEEVAERARHQGAVVLFGRCFESDWAPPYGPFVEALDAYVGSADAVALLGDLGPGAPPLAQLVPKIRKVLPDVPDRVAVEPDEERFRLIDAMAQFVVATSQRAPVVVCVDDLQWADRGSIAMFRHLARFAPRQRVLVLGAYRDVDVDRAHPLTGALQALRRETEYEHVSLGQLPAEGVRSVLEGLAQHPLPSQVGTAWNREVGGNPFFLQEMVRHLAETGDLYVDESGHWTTTRPIRELSLPEGIYDVLARRISHLSEAANQLLTVAAAFEGTFRFDVVATVAGLDELDALDALDEALEAQVVKPAGADHYALASALVRQCLHADLNPSRQMRLHRRVAQALESAYGGRPSPAEAAEIASQYHRSAGLSGADRGVAPALLAAKHAQATGAHDEAGAYLRMAIEMLPPGDDRRPRLLGRLAVVLAWALDFERAVATAAEAADAIAAAEGDEAAAEYCSEAAYVCAQAGGIVPSWEVARKGLSYAQARNVAWARLVTFDYQRREAEDVENPGIPFDTPERREAAGILRAARLDPLGPAPMEAVFDSRDEALEGSNLVVLTIWGGEYGRAIPLCQAQVAEAESLGRVARAARAWATLAWCHVSLGRLSEAREAVERGEALAARLGQPIFAVLQARQFLSLALDEGWEDLLAVYGGVVTSTNPALAWAKGFAYANAARMAARLGQAEDALRWLGLAVPWLERAPAWTLGFSNIGCDAAETLWHLERLDHAELIERVLAERTIPPDFRYPMMEPRLALARLRALQGDHDDAAAWFSRARRTLAEQGARPLRAICDYDEALMWIRRGAPQDEARARRLLDAALEEFRAIGMTGWLRRAEQLAEDIA